MWASEAMTLTTETKERDKMSTTDKTAFGARKLAVIRTAKQLTASRAADIAANGGDGENVHWSDTTIAAESAHTRAVRREAVGMLVASLVSAHSRAVEVAHGAPVTEKEAEIARSLRPWHPTAAAAILADVQQSLFGWPGFAPGRGWVARRLANIG